MISCVQLTQNEARRPTHCRLHPHASEPCLLLPQVHSPAPPTPGGYGNDRGTASYLLPRGSAWTALAPPKLQTGFLSRVDSEPVRTRPVTCQRGGSGEAVTRVTQGYDNRGQSQEGQ